MKAVGVPAVLRERLGNPGADAQTEMLDTRTRESIDYAIERAAERFECRLVEETSKIRVDMASMRSDLSGQIAAGRFDPIKWSFASWLGQLVALAGILTMMLRGR